jgi:Protein of unknown function (DUF3866)
MSAARYRVRLRYGRVVAIVAERPGAVELEVEVDGERAGAMAFTELVGAVGEGDIVLLNTSAVALGLGTGGFHLVVSLADAPSTELGDVGRVMKARYTPLQPVVSSVEETHREQIEGSSELAGTPVVCAPLHSMIAPIAAGARAAGAERVVYVMTDGASLTGAFSRLVPALRGTGLLAGFVTTGQASGGELEAVTIWTGMIAATEVAGADVVVVADGPGNLGTDTTWGVSALGSGEALNAVEALGGRPVAALRISFADRRARHHGVSHHSLTILERVCSIRANVVVPALEGAERALVWETLRGRKLEERHQLVEAGGEPALRELKRAGVEVESMGRTPSDDPVFFLAAGAAGVVAGRMAESSKRWRAGRA